MARTPKAESRKAVRLNFLVRPSLKALFESLKERTKADSMTEVLRTALNLYDYIIAVHERGDAFCVRAPDGTVTGLVFPEFEHLRRKSTERQSPPHEPPQ